MLGVLVVFGVLAAQATDQEAAVDGVDALIERALLTWASNSTDLDETAHAKVATVPMQAPPAVPQRIMQQRVMQQPTRVTLIDGIAAPQAKVFPLSVMIPPTTEEILARVEAKKAAAAEAKAAAKPATKAPATTAPTTKAAAPVAKATATKPVSVVTAVKDSAKAASKPRVAATATATKPAPVTKTDPAAKTKAQKVEADKKKAEAEKKKKAEAEKKKKEAAKKQQSGDGPLGGIVALGGGAAAAYFAATNDLPNPADLDADKLGDMFPKSGESWGRRRGSSPFPKEADPFWEQNNPEMLAQEGSVDNMSAIAVAVMGLALGSGVTTLALRFNRGTAAAAERW